MSGVGVASTLARTLTYPLPGLPPFGMHQVAASRRQDHVYEYLIGIEQRVRSYIEGLGLLDGSGKRLEVNKAYAFTYAERCDTKSRGDLQEVRFGGILQRICSLAAEDEGIAVPIGGLEWRMSRVVAPRGQNSAGSKRLYDLHTELELILCGAVMEEPPVNRPHHPPVSGARVFFAHIRMHTRIYQHQHKANLDMVDAQLTSAGIDSVELGQVTYRQKLYDSIVAYRLAFGGMRTYRILQRFTRKVKGIIRSMP